MRRCDVAVRSGGAEIDVAILRYYNRRNCATGLISAKVKPARSVLVGAGAEVSPQAVPQLLRRVPRLSDDVTRVNGQLFVPRKRAMYNSRTSTSRNPSCIAKSVAKGTTEGGGSGREGCMRVDGDGGDGDANARAVARLRKLGSAEMRKIEAEALAEEYARRLAALGTRAPLNVLEPFPEEPVKVKMDDKPKQFNVNRMHLYQYRKEMIRWYKQEIARLAEAALSAPPAPASITGSSM